MESILTTAFGVAVGALFVFLGRRLYSNPRGLFPSWGILNREHSGVQKLSRIYATFFIFMGLLAGGSVILAQLMLGIPGMAILAIALAAIGAWFLRPQLPEVASVPAVPTIPAVGGPTETEQKQSLLSKHWKRTVAIFAGLMVVLWLVLSVVIDNSDASKMALAAAQASPVVTQQIGEPIKRGLFTDGSIEMSGSTGNADLAIPISGPKGKATLYAVARKNAGIWKLETLEVAFNENDARVDLLEKGSQPAAK
jgi:hypothetical protein